MRARERGDGRAASWVGRAMRDDPDRALGHLRFSDESGDPEGSRELGLALKASGDFAGAEAAFRRADERGSPSGSLALGLLLRDERNDLQGAEAAFRRAEQRSHPKGALNLIDIYSDRGDSAAAGQARERTMESRREASNGLRRNAGPELRRVRLDGPRKDRRSRERLCDYRCSGVGGVRDRDDPRPRLEAPGPRRLADTS